MVEQQRKQPLKGHLKGNTSVRVSFKTTFWAHNLKPTVRMLKVTGYTRASPLLSVFANSLFDRDRARGGLFEQKPKLKKLLFSLSNKTPSQWNYHPNSKAPARGPCTCLKGSWPVCRGFWGVGVGRSNPRTKGLGALAVQWAWYFKWAWWIANYHCHSPKRLRKTQKRTCLDKTIFHLLNIVNSCWEIQIFGLIEPLLWRFQPFEGLLHDCLQLR